MTESAASARAEVPWKLSLFLVAVFYLAAPMSLTFSANELVNLGTNDAPISDRVEGNIQANTLGSLARQVALSGLACFGVFTLCRPCANKLKITCLLGLAVFFFLAWSAISVFWSETPITTVKRIAVLAFLCLGALAVAKLLSLTQIVELTAFSCGLVLLLGLVAELILGTFRPFVSHYRFSGLDWPAFTAWTASLLFLAAMTQLATTRRRWHILVAAMLLAFPLVFLTKTRVGAVGLLLGILFCATLTWSAKRKFIVMLASCGIMSTVCLAAEFVGYDTGSTLFEAANLGRSESAEGLSGRSALWRELITYIESRPFLGYGYESFWTPQHLARIGGSHWGAPDAHNGFLNLSLGVGLIGSLAFELILLLGLVRAITLYYQSHHAEYVFAGGVLVILFVNALTVSPQLGPTLFNFVGMVVLAKLSVGKGPHADGDSVVQNSCYQGPCLQT